MAEPRAKILCADDDEGWRDLLSQWLKPHCELALCAKGAEVCGRVESFQPDCVILDLEMGDLRGSQVCAQIKARPQWARIPVIILTSLAAQMFDAVSEGGPDHFVVKSESPDELLAILQTLLEKKGFTGGRKA
jgi:CheY-like chemotaxis protein